MAGNNQAGSIYQKFANAIDRHFKYIVIVIIGIQVLKGVALYESAYARGQYLWSYSEGFIKRGFIGTLALFFEGHNNYRIIGIINFFSYFFYFLLIFLLYRFIMNKAQTIMQKVMAVLFLSSPFLIAMGALLGYFDLLILSLLLIIYNFCDKKDIPALPYFVFVTIAIMVHEMSLFFLVLPLLYLIWMHPITSPRKKYFLIGATLTLCIIYLLFISGQNIAFTKVLNGRISEYKQILSTKSGEKFFEFYTGYALKNNFLQDLRVPRLRMLVVLLPIYGFFILMSNWIVLPELLKTKKYKDALFYLAACYAPLLIIIVGWDADRFVCDGILTAYISFLIITKSYPAITERKPGKMQLMFITALSIIALLTYYPISDNYGEAETLLSRDKQKVLLQYPDKIITSWKKLVVPKKNAPLPGEDPKGK